MYCFATAQSTCDYKINVDTQEEIFQLTQESLIDFTVREKKTIFVYFSLMKQDSVKSVGTKHLVKQPGNTTCYLL